MATEAARARAQVHAYRLASLRAALLPDAETRDLLHQIAELEQIYRAPDQYAALPIHERKDVDDRYFALLAVYQDRRAKKRAERKSEP